MEDSDLIAAYLDHIDGKPTLYLPPWHDNWEYGRLEAGARSLLDGLAVLVREIRRPENGRSPGIIALTGAKIASTLESVERLLSKVSTNIRQRLPMPG
jgi:hypothetical protein